MDSVSVVLVANELYHDWALPGVLGAFLIALAQAAYVVLSTKRREVTKHYLRIREILAGTFRTTLFREVRAVFKAVEDRLPSALMRRGIDDDHRSQFELLLEGLSGLDPDEAEAADYELVLQHQLAGVVTSRVEALLVEAERAASGDDHGRGAGGLVISFHEATVDDFVYLARALHLTRKREERFDLGRKWSRRSFYVLVPSYAALVGSMLFQEAWAYWVAVGALIGFGTSALVSLIASSVALGSLWWLAEKAEAPDTDRLFRTEMTS